jgi:predicted GTPase
MSRWRIALVLGLILVPFIVLAGIGSYQLWIGGWAFIVWLPLALCTGLGYWLAWHWQRKKRLLGAPEFEPLPRWTERDREAFKLVEAKAKAGAELPGEKLSELQHYFTTAQDLAKELAAFYHPNKAEPMANVTVPEVLVVVELAAHDLCEMVDKHLPGGHLLTINQWRQARKMVGYAQTANNLYWIGAALFDPIQTGMRYLASRVGFSEPWRMLQQNLFLWFYTAYVHRLGTYLIELNSGRLRVGADRYRQLFGGLAQAPVVEGTATEAPADEAVDRINELKVTVFGQAKAGKSSTINALLGEQRARADVLPVLDGAQRYQLRTPEVPTQLVLLDTIGYGQAGPRADQINATREAARGSDLLLLVLHARNPARQADVELLKGLKGWFAERPDLKRPAILAVLTHVDLLSPSLEWAPPYDWEKPTRPKEKSIAEAVAAAKEQFGDLVDGVVPVCTAPGKVWNVEEGVLATVASRFDEAHGVALLRCLKAEASKDSVRKVFRQLFATGKVAAQLAWQKFKEGK